MRAHITRVIMDVVRRYDIDAVHFDDYFYPYQEPKLVFHDEATFAQRPEQDIARDRAVQPRLKPPAAAQPDDAAPVLGAAREQKGAHQHVAEHDQTAEVMERYLRRRFALHVDFQRVVLEPQIAPLSLHVEGVEKLLHSLTSNSAGSPR